MVKVRFQATLHRPGGPDKGARWSFVHLPQEASDKLPSRSMVSVDGSMNGFSFAATLEPDGKGGHWLKVTPELASAAGAGPGDQVDLEMRPVTQEPEPEVPQDFQSALLQATDKARLTWKDITPLARRDWIHWITSGKKAETRKKRIEVACSKLSAGQRRACCFDRSGKFSNSMSCPIPDDGT